ncbi:MAG TPA: hypothetical protein VN426_01480 [Syntrophomonadaceae bacterium]|nr:hypothetical protein [Syntrophomonadaceae bacterium]
MAGKKGSKDKKDSKISDNGAKRIEDQHDSDSTGIPGSKTKKNKK